MAEGRDRGWPGLLCAFPPLPLPALLKTTHTHTHSTQTAQRGLVRGDEKQSEKGVKGGGRGPSCKVKSPAFLCASSNPLFQASQSEGKRECAPKEGPPPLS